MAHIEVNLEMKHEARISNYGGELRPYMAITKMMVADQEGIQILVIGPGTDENPKTLDLRMTTDIAEDLANTLKLISQSNAQTIGFELPAKRASPTPTRSLRRYGIVYIFKPDRTTVVSL